MSHSSSGPLQGIRVLEVGQLLAGPFAGTMLGYFGAEVIKVEPPGQGDPIRRWRIIRDGTSLWWRSLARNKKCITLDLKSEEGRKIILRLAKESDVLIENFRPGTMEKWSLGPEDLKKDNPGLIYTRVSGYGQTGPYASRPGFASVCEGISGFRYINGFPGKAPVRPNLSMGDTLAGLHATIGIMMALRARDQHSNQEGQTIDVALYESIFNIMESIVPEYDGANIIREPSGSTVTGIVPTNTYRCKDGKFVVIGGNGDSIFSRLMIAAGHPEMAEDRRLADNEGRVQHEKEIDDVLSTWTSTLNSLEVLEKLEEAKVPSGPIYNIEDIVNDPHFQEREMFEEVKVNGEPLKIPAITPKLVSTPGKTHWPGPTIGSHNQEIFQDKLGLSEEEIEKLRQKGVI